MKEAGLKAEGLGHAQRPLAEARQRIPEFSKQMKLTALRKWYSKQLQRKQEFTSALVETKNRFETMAFVAVELGSRLPGVSGFGFNDPEKSVGSYSRKLLKDEAENYPRFCDSRDGFAEFAKKPTGPPIAGLASQTMELAQLIPGISLEDLVRTSQATEIPAALRLRG